MHKEQRQRHKTYWEGWGVGGTHCRREREKTVGESWKRQCYGRHRHFDLENGTICFCLAPVYHISVLRLRREKLHKLSPKTRGPLDWKKKSSQSSSSIDSSLKPLRRLILCLWTSIFFSPQIVSLTSKANLDLHLLPLYQISIGKPCWKTLKGTKKARLHRHISTSTICSLACSG